MQRENVSSSPETSTAVHPSATPVAVSAADSSATHREDSNLETTRDDASDFSSRRETLAPKGKTQTSPQARAIVSDPVFETLAASEVKRRANVTRALIAKDVHDIAHRHIVPLMMRLSAVDPEAAEDLGSLGMALDGFADELDAEVLRYRLESGEAVDL